MFSGLAVITLLYYLKNSKVKLSNKFLDWLKNLKIVFLKSNDKISEEFLASAFDEKLKALVDILGFKISQPEYFIKALTHRSYLEILPELKKSNERLEFLGDSVLGAVVAEYLFKKYPEEGEGFLTKARARLVNKALLADAAELMGLKNFILFDKRYIKSSLKGMHTIQADAFEALIGAIYLDAGLEVSRKFILKRIIKPFINTEKFKSDQNYKGQLLEFAHAQKMETPIYRVVREEGPEHQKTFTIDVLIGNEIFGSGQGKNKKQTEQEAAKIALEKLLHENS